MLLAAQALEFHRPARFGQGTRRLHARLRRRIPAFDEDRFLSPDLSAAEAFLRDEEELVELDAALAGRE